MDSFDLDLPVNENEQVDREDIGVLIRMDDSIDWGLPSYLRWLDEDNGGSVPNVGDDDDFSR